jgi:hypothetical protein
MISVLLYDLLKATAYVRDRFTGQVFRSRESHSCIIMALSYINEPGFLEHNFSFTKPQINEQHGLESRPFGVRSVHNHGRLDRSQATINYIPDHQHSYLVLNVLYIIHYIFVPTIDSSGPRGSLVGWGTMLQPESRGFNFRWGYWIFQLT